MFLEKSTFTIEFKPASKLFKAIKSSIPVKSTILSSFISKLSSTEILSVSTKPSLFIPFPKPLNSK